jgi:hypothetical protein
MYDDKFNLIVPLLIGTNMLSHLVSDLKCHIGPDLLDKVTMPRAAHGL